METHERIKYFRKEVKKLSQEKFGEELGVSRDVINNIESNRLKMPEQKEPLYRLISEKFGVSLSWLKCESEDMYPPRNRGQEIADIVKAASEHDPETAAKFFSSLLEEMSDAEIVLMYEIFKRHFGTVEKEKG